VIAATSLRLINEAFSSDQAAAVESLVLNGIVKTISPEKGDDISPCIVSVRATRDEFSKINLSRIDPVSCLKALGAVSKKPDELAPVRPIMEFDMVDPRFVSELDVISNLESRPNIMELSPFEFETLVTNLFSKMGLDTRQTRSSRDGGVDAVAFDPRPVLGGKIVIQAKRYKNTVGVAAVRELYGTMINEGANKGILVTTAGYGPDAYEFAKDKPIELYEGTRLLYLLEQQGVRARIVMPA
jgi:restriction system protein